MSSAREIPEAVQWHEGMMLAPQHFQVQSQRAEQIAVYHVAAATPFHWGIRTLMIDRVALMSGTFRVLELEAIMPDGLIVQHAVDRGDLDLDITGFAGDAAHAPLTLHLAVPVARPGANAAGEGARYASVDGPPLTDETSGDGELSIPRLRPLLQLVATLGTGQKPPQKYISMPIAQVMYQGEAFAMTTYIPPYLAVTEGSPLGKLVAEIARRSREKGLQLLERVGARGTGTPGSDGLEEMQGLVAGLPPLEAMLATGAVHPFTLYLALCGLIGQIAAFGARTIPPVLGRYDHNNCVLAFGEIRDYVGRILDRVAETFIAIPFVFDNGKFGLTLEEPWATRKLIIGVRGPSNQSESVVAGWVENSLIASREQIDKLWEMRVMGAARALVDTEGELPVSPPRGTVLFEIDNDPSYITPGQTLEIWNADSRTNRYRPIDIVLYVRAGTGAAR